MLIFSRLVTLSGGPRRAMPWALRATSYVNERTSHNYGLWSATFGYPVGTVAWTTLAESQVALAADTAALAADDGFNDLIDEGGDLMRAAPEDRLAEIVHSGPAQPAPAGAVATVTTGQAVFDRMGDALAWGVEIADYVAGIIGVPVTLATGVYGDLGQVVWIATQPDLAAAEAGRAKLAAEPDYLGRMAAARDLFVPATGHMAQFTRVA